MTALLIQDSDIDGYGRGSGSTPDDINEYDYSFGGEKGFGWGLGRACGACRSDNLGHGGGDAFGSGFRNSSGIG